MNPGVKAELSLRRAGRVKSAGEEEKEHPPGHEAGHARGEGEAL